MAASHESTSLFQIVSIPLQELVKWYRPKANGPTATKLCLRSVYPLGEGFWTTCFAVLGWTRVKPTTLSSKILCQKQYIKGFHVD